MRWGDILFVAALMVLLALTMFVPRPDSPNAEPPPVLEGATIWGETSKSGKMVVIVGHPHWEAQGHYQDDGSLFLHWTEKTNGNQAISVYRFTKTGWEGQWGYEDEVHLDEMGMLHGNSKFDRLTFKR